MRRRGSRLRKIDALVAHWKFEGNLIEEIFGNNGIGTATYGPGKIGDCAIFDGITNDIATENTDALKLQKGTIMGWVKTTGNPTEKGLFVKTSSYGLYIRDNNLAAFSYGSPSEWHLTNVNIATNTWRHVAQTFEFDVINKTKYYVDGILVLTATLRFSNDNHDLQIASNTSSARFTGSIDDVRIYNIILSGEEILQIYNSAN